MRKPTAPSAHAEALQIDRKRISDLVFNSCGCALPVSENDHLVFAQVGNGVDRRMQQRPVANAAARHKYQDQPGFFIENSMMRLIILPLPGVLVCVMFARMAILRASTMTVNCRHTGWPCPYTFRDHSPTRENVFFISGMPLTASRHDERERDSCVDNRLPSAPVTFT